MKKMKIVLTLTLPVLLLISAPRAYAGDEVEALQAKNNALLANNTMLRGSIKSKKKQIEKLKDEIKLLSEDKDQALQDNEELRDKIKSLEAQIKKLKTKPAKKAVKKAPKKVAPKKAAKPKKAPAAKKATPAKTKKAAPAAKAPAAKKAAKKPAKLGKWDGFRKLAWGSPEKNVKDLANKKVDEDNESVSYTRKGDKLKLGPAALEQIRYVFYKGKFFRVQIDIKNAENIANLRKIVELRYGKPVKSGSWVGTSSSKKPITVSLEEDSQKISLTITYKPIHNQMLKDAKEAEKKAAEDDF